jgi:hypothetical protein
VADTCVVDLDADLMGLPRQRPPINACQRRQAR